MEFTLYEKEVDNWKPCRDFAAETFTLASIQVQAYLFAAWGGNDGSDVTLKGTLEGEAWQYEVIATFGKMSLVSKYLLCDKQARDSKGSGG